MVTVVAVINPSLVYRTPLPPDPPCCARTTYAHLFGCRHWTPRVDLESFRVEIAYDDGTSVGYHVLGARALGRLCIGFARRAMPWRYTLLYAEGNYLDVPHVHVVPPARRL